MENDSVHGRWRRFAMSTGVFLLVFGLSACSQPSVPSESFVSAAEDIVEEEIAENQLVMKVPGAEDFEIPLDEVTVTVYNACKDDTLADNAVKRLKMMGIQHIIRKDTTSMDMFIVVYRAPEYRQIAELIGEDLGLQGAMEISNDGSGGWSYGTDIAVVVYEK